MGRNLALRKSLAPQGSRISPSILVCNRAALRFVSMEDIVFPIFREFYVIINTVVIKFPD